MRKTILSISLIVMALFAVSVSLQEAQAADPLPEFTNDQCGKLFGPKSELNFCYEYVQEPMTQSGKIVDKFWCCCDDEAVDNFGGTNFWSVLGSFRPGIGIGVGGTQFDAGTCPDVVVAQDTQAFWKGQCASCPSGFSVSPDDYPKGTLEGGLEPATGSSIGSAEDLNPILGLANIVSQWYAIGFFLAVILAFLMIVYGGVEYSTAAGNAEKTTNAKNIIIEAIIGLGIALLSGAILVYLRGTEVFNLL